MSDRWVGRSRLGASASRVLLGAALSVGMVTVGLAGSITPAGAANPSADLSVVKTGPSTAARGANVTFTVTVHNNGPSAAVPAAIRDVMPGGTQFVSESQTSGPVFTCTNPAVNATSGQTICRLASMASGATAVFKLTYFVPANNTATSIDNTAQVASINTNGSQGTPDPDPSNNQSSVTVQLVDSSADLSIIKTGPGSPVAPGSNAAYTVTVHNNGPSPATNVSWTDTTPTGTTFVSLNQGSGPAFNCTNPTVGNTGTSTCTLATMANGATAVFTYTVKVTSPATQTSISNEADVTSGTPDPDPSNNSSTATTQLITADLAITKVLTSPTPTATPGVNVVYTVTVTNNGPSAAAAPVMTDLTPTANGLTEPGAPVVGGTFTNWTCTTPTDTCTAGAPMPSGTSTTFTITYALTASSTATSITNTATVSSTTNDQNPNNNSATVTTQVVPKADLSVVKTETDAVAKPAKAGDTLKWQVVVTNNGPSDAQNIVMTDNWTPATNSTSLTWSAGSCAASGAISGFGCTLATLANGATVTYTATYLVPTTTATAVVNTASVSSSTNDPNPANNSSQVDTQLQNAQSADVSITKTGPAQALPGGQIQYTITVKNNGPGTAAGLDWKDVTPSGTTFNSESQIGGPSPYGCTNPASGSPGTVECTFGSIGNGETDTFQVTLNITGAPTGCALSNTATITTTSTDPNSANNSSTADTEILCADVAVTKTANSTSVAPGGTLAYTVTVTNNGPSAATNVSLTDTVPAGMTFKSETQGSGPVFTCTNPAVNSAGTSVCTLASMADDAVAVFTFTYNLPVGATASTVTNTASVTSNTFDTDATNNSQTVTTSVVPQADLSVVKTETDNVPKPAAPGSVLSYSVVVHNNGPSNAANLTLFDNWTPKTNTVGGTCAAGWTCTLGAGPPFGGGTATIASLAAGATSTFTFTYTVPSPLPGPITITNSASITSQTNDPNTNNNTSTVTTQAGPASNTQSADLSVDKTGPTSATSGSTITYTITVTNNGPGSAASAMMTDTIPANTTWAGGSQFSGPAFSCTAPALGSSSGQVKCTIASLANGGSAVFKLKFKITGAGGSSVDNTALVSSNTSDPQPANNQSSVSTQVT